MKTYKCRECEVSFKDWPGRFRKYCSRSCSMTRNNRNRRRHGKAYHCAACKQRIITTKYTKKYCNETCREKAKQKRHEQYIENWKLGKVTGIENGTLTVKPVVKEYLRKKYNNKCCLCGWNKINPYTNKVPVVADHIDGNWKNNIEKNLRLICPNCDSLNKTYGGANKGNGRRSYRKKMRT